MPDKDITKLTVQYKRRLNSASDTDFFVCIYVSKVFNDIPADVQLKNRAKKGCEFTALGFALPTVLDVDIELYGEWTKTKYGTQFKVSASKLIPPTDEKGIIAFLSSGRIKGIGRATAEKIVAMFGKDAINVVSETPEKLGAIRGIREKTIENIKISYKENEAYTKIAVFLGKYEFSNDKINQIYLEYKNDAVDLIKENPFCIMDITGIGFILADRIARGLGVMLDSDTRIIACVKAVLSDDSHTKGNMFTYSEELEKTVLERLNQGFDMPIISKEMYQEALEKAKANKDIVVRAKNRVYSYVNDQVEFKTSRNIERLMSAKTVDYYDWELENWEDNHKNIILAETQKKAIIMALTNNVSIITGGAGTGKTTVLKVILECYQHHNPHKKVTLLAPTGKASRRMSESTGYPASTIHKALSLSTGEGDLYCNGEELEGLIIVDEVSMVDNYVANALLQSIRSYSQIVFVGDANQLPSVGAGNVLSELIRSKVVPVTILDKIYRQGKESNIIDNSYKINNGDTNLAYEKNFFLKYANGEENAKNVLIETYNEEILKWGLENVIILCPLRKNKNVCVNTLNSAIQNIVNPTVSGEITATVNGIEFRQRDKVIQTKNNDYAANGDVGILSKINVVTDEDGSQDIQFTIEFEGEENNIVVYDKKEMENVELAYALTIHKSQGSEYKSVIIPILSTQRCILFKRNLLYTAVTRAKEKVTLVGDKNAINYCIKTNDTNKRNTLLADRLFHLLPTIN